ncbi:replication endonuclease, partial [Burkholderia sola]
QALEKALPPQWLQPMKLLGLGDWQKRAQHASGQPEWAACHDALAAIDDFASRHGRAAEWNLDDYEICQMARRLSDEVGELDAGAQAQNMDLAARVDLVRLMLRMLGLQESQPLAGEPAIRRALDAAWWRRMLR